MTDKVHKIREEVERLRVEVMGIRTDFADGQKSVLTKLLAYIDSLQEEPVSERFSFKAIPRLLEMIEPTDRAKSYVAKLADAFDSEGYYTDAKIVRESLKIMIGEKVAMATMDEERVSEKKCMYSKDNYTGEDRKVLCEGCDAECKYSKQSVDEAMAEIEEKAKAFTKAHKGESADEILSEMRGKEPVSDDLEKVVEEIVDPIVLNAYGVKEIANRLRRTMIEPVSDELEQASHQFVFNTPSLILPLFHDADLKWEKTATEELERAFKAGANWQKECLMKDAVDGEIGYWNIRGLSVNMDLPRTLEEDDKVKLIIIKED
jgi:hypothetical protein